MKITDMILSALIKKGILCEARDIDTNIEIPFEDKMIKVYIKCEHMTLKFEKD
ncbi:MAG: hypothetical protein GX660_25575 [Clostridiaceae bacterium]|nr:hypothetical protein [Clostridiaceae bacterium]